MSITITDVAKRAGVSVSTVSKVLNGWSTISDETCKRVRKAAQELDYTPNARAVSFAKKSTDTIIFLTSLSKEEAYKNPHMFDIMCGIHKSLSQYSYSLMLVDTSSESILGETVSNLISNRSCDGMIIHGSALNEEIASELSASGFPHIVIGNPNYSNQLCWVDTNHMLAGEFAATHLLSQGYKNIAFIGGRKTDMISKQRLKGVRSVLLKSNHRISPSHIAYTDSSRQAAYEATVSLLSCEKKDLPDAIICENNLIAFGVSRALEHHKIDIPKELAFLTFDRYPYASVIDPSPTIIDIDVFDMGLQAGKMMIRKLKNPSLLVQSYTTLPIVIQGETT